jgi:hypothetical protein
MIALWVTLLAAEPELVELVRAHCLECHDETHDLDLRTLPAPEDSSAWRSIYQQVYAQRMPPPKEGQVEERFPLDPAVRRRILTLIAPLLARAAPARPPAPRMLRPAEWDAVALEVAGAFGVELSRFFMVPYSGAGGADPVANRWFLERRAQVACAELAEKAPNRPEVGALFAAVFQAPADPATLAAAEAVERRAAADERGEADPWIAVCTFFLTHPRLLFSLAPEAR